MAKQKFNVGQNVLFQYDPKTDDDGWHKGEIVRKEGEQCAVRELSCDPNLHGDIHHLHVGTIRVTDAENESSVNATNAENVIGVRSVNTECSEPRMFHPCKENNAEVQEPNVGNAMGNFYGDFSNFLERY